MIVFGYPQPGKAKSERLLRAFCRGAGGFLAAPAGGLSDFRGRHADAAAFYGTVGIEPLFRQARALCAAWFYMDNAYFDRAREKLFRVSRGALQQVGGGAPDFARLEALGLTFAPWQRGGGHVLVVEQSDYFMTELAGWPGGLLGWRTFVLDTLKRHTDREIRIRPWQRDKAKASRTLGEDLAGAHALVTHASAAANEALLLGVPVFVTGPSVALPLGLSQLSEIERPRRPDGRREWAAQLAAKQWTEDELRSGAAYRALTTEEER